MWQKISDQVPAASRNNSPPILGIFLEFLFLEWIDLLADETGDHDFPLSTVFTRRKSHVSGGTSGNLATSSAVCQLTDMNTLLSIKV
jgi:hypothetical protein